MPRLTKAQKQETVETFYGINRTTFAVESVSLSRDGVLSRFDSEMRLITHPVLKGRDAKSEVVNVFGLIDIVSLHEGFTTEERRKTVLLDLRKRAAQLRAEAEAKKPD